jgi:glycosyltransferase involved in cell wall biosynthesis
MQRGNQRIVDDQPHIAFLFSEYPAVPPALCDSEMQALEAAGFRLTVASLAVPDDCFQRLRPPALKAEILYPPPRAMREMLRSGPPQDASWRAMTGVAAEHAKKYPPDIVTPGLERTAWLYARELRRRGVQHVHVRSPAALPAALYLKRAGLPFSFTVESVSSGEDARDDLLRELLEEAEFVAAAGESTRAALTAKAPEAADKIHRVYPGIDASRYHAALCGDAGILRLVCIAAPGQEPHISLLLDAMAKLNEAAIDAELCIAGDGPWRTSVKQEMALLSLNGHLRFCRMPDHEEAKRLLAASDVFIHLDAAGGAELSPRIMEAMATGLPVVALAQPGTEELIADGKTGWLVSPDVEALAERLAILAGDPALRAEAGHAGLERMQEVFSLRHTARPLADQFRKSIAGRFAPAMASQAAGVLCLLENWPYDSADVILTDELRFLQGQAGVDLMAANAGPVDAMRMPPESMEFLPDGAVLESVWRQESGLADRAASLRNACPCTPGEEFFLAARRAVYLAALQSARGWTHVHALRSSTALWAWLLHRLTGISLSAALEPGHAQAPETLTEIASAFSFGSVADGRIAGNIPNVLHPALAAGSRRLFGLLPASKQAPEDPATVWSRWLNQARQRR